MQDAVSQFLRIARLTTREAIRQPICLLLFLVCISLIAALPFLISYSMGDLERIVRDSAMALHFVVGLLLGCYAACSAFVREIHRGTAASVLSKPVRRGVFFLAKFAGVGGVMLLFSAGVAAATLLSTRAAAIYDTQFTPAWRSSGPLLAAPLLACGIGAIWNFSRKRPFNSAAFRVLLVLLLAAATLEAVRGHGVDSETAWPLFARLLPASFLITVAVLVICALAVSLATRLDLVPTFSICAIVFFLGLVSDYLFGRAALAGNRLASLCHHLLPNWQHFWMVDVVQHAHGISWAYVAAASGYAALYGGGILLLGLAAFNRMELR